MAAEETTWIAYYRQSPFGEYRADIRSAQIAQILFNSNVKKDKAKKLQDFLLFNQPTKAQQSNAALKVKTNFDNFMALQKAKGIVTRPFERKK